MEATVDVLMVAIPKMFPEIAVMVVDPIVSKAVTIPCEPGALLTVAIVVFDEVQVTNVVMFCPMLLE